MLAALPLTAGTADAAAKCPNGNICGWTQPNFEGQESDVFTPSSGCNAFDQDNVRSVSNQDYHRVTFYSDSGCYGQHFDLTRGQYSAKTPWPVRSIAVWGPDK
ncbi:peptidase inhibitor family I36 protein [Streptomyces sp. CT34]|uniref:peptidase inhibitor family I36 protein n=1 Tax=Streptomyces sp. CT34 TaxID=1553907 RepID=UPI000A955DCB|nr:peptidase inhibitor family I36 protein [Streptomyces sp. CT34]